MDFMGSWFERSRFTSLIARGREAGSYLIYQSLIQCITLVAAIVVVRLFSKNEYAVVTIALAAGTLFSIITDVGIGTALKSIGGKVVDDPPKYRAVLEAVLRVRKKLALPSFAVVALYTYALVAITDPRLDQAVAMAALITLSCWPLTYGPIYKTGMLLQRRANESQKIELIVAASRLACVATILPLFPQAVTFIYIILGSNLLSALLYRFAIYPASKGVDGRERHSEESIWRLTRKLAPNSLFFAVQGQIAITLLAIFGVTSNIAELGAIMRIGMPIAMIGTMFVNVFAMRFATISDGNRLRQAYIKTLSAAVVVSVPIIALTYCYPESLLLLLGPEYSVLQPELRLAALCATITMISGTMLALNQGQAWVGAYSNFFVPLAIILQLLIILTANVGAVSGAILLSAAAPLAVMILSAVDAATGLVNPGRATRHK